MKRWMQAIAFTGLLGSATGALAAPRVSILNDAQYFCAGCGGAFSHAILRDSLVSVYPDAQLIPTIDAATLGSALARTDILFVPFQWDKPMHTALSEESTAALKSFVTNGGRIVFRTDYTDGTRHNRDLVEKIFGVRFGAVTSVPTPNFTCDNQAALNLGWQTIPASGRVPFYANVYTGTTLPATAVSLCQLQGSQGMLVVAMPFGDGMIYFDGSLNTAVSDFSAEQRTFARQMTEADLVGPHRCFVKNGVTKCSGGNSHGQLGLGDKTPHTDVYSAIQPVSLGQDFSVARVEHATGSSCALSSQGKLKCWGMNKDGQLGIGDALPRGDETAELGDQLPSVDFGNVRVDDFAVGRAHACAVTADGKLRCWGKGANGQLGSEATASVGAQAGEVPVTVSLPARPKAVRAGRNHTCVLFDDKAVACFGDNASGQLGAGHTRPIGAEAGTMGGNLQKVNLGANFDVEVLATGMDHACALSARGEIKCWGANDSGQLGQGRALATVGGKPEELGDALPVTDIGEGQVATGLTCGFFHCCATTLSNTAKCWGANDSGQLGLGDAISRGRADDMGDHLPFTKLPPNERVQAIEAVGNTTCARTESGTRCWGGNSTGQLATGDRLDRGNNPATIPRLLVPLF